MFRTATILLALGLLGATSTAQPSAHRDPTDAAIVQVGRQLVQQDHAVGVAIGVIEGGRVYEQFFGATAKGGAAPDGKTLFGIGSVTKTFAAALLAAAVHEHRATLNDPLMQYLPGVTVRGKKKRSITLLELADHASGLPRKPKATGGTVTYQGMDAELATLRLKFTPGAGYLYSNLAFGYLGQAEIAAFHGASWEDLVRTKIVQPLGMTDTVVTVTRAMRARLAQSYAKNGNPAPFDRPGFPGDQAAGAIVSDLDDMMKYLGWMMGSGPGHTGELAAVRAMLLVPHNQMPKPGMKVALAWQLAKLSDGRAYVDKDGLILGFSSYVAFLNDGSVGVVILTNTRVGLGRSAKQLLATLAGGITAPDTPSEDAADE